MHGNDSPYGLCYTYTWRLTVPTIYKRSALEVYDGEVRPHSTYKRKESIGSNVLHMISVQLSLEILGGLPQICKKKKKITEIAFLWIRDHKVDFFFKEKCQLNEKMNIFSISFINIFGG